jgi:hypothetical protein
MSLNADRRFLCRDFAIFRIFSPACRDIRKEVITTMAMANLAMMPIITMINKVITIKATEDMINMVKRIMTNR